MEWIWVHLFFPAPLFWYGLELRIVQDWIFLWNFHPGPFKKTLANLVILGSFPTCKVMPNNLPQRKNDKEEKKKENNKKPHKSLLVVGTAGIFLRKKTISGESAQTLCFSYFQAESNSFSQPYSFLTNSFCPEYFWRGILQAKQKQTAKIFSGQPPSEYMKWPSRFFYYPPPVLFFLCCPSPACVLLLLLLVCSPHLLHPRQVILDLYFQATFGDRLWEVCSRSMKQNCIHWFVWALYTEFSYSVYLRGGKAHPPGYDSPSISWTCELDFWMLPAFPSAAALCYPREKMQKGSRALCASPWL